MNPFTYLTDLAYECIVLTVDITRDLGRTYERWSERDKGNTGRACSKCGNLGRDHSNS